MAPWCCTWRRRRRPAGRWRWLRNGDLITLDVGARSLHLHVDNAELAARRAAWNRPPQANEGADFDFLVGRSGSPVPRDNH